MIRWVLNGILALIVLIAAIVFFRFQIKDDGLLIQFREEKERKELIQSVEDVKDSTRELADKLQEKAKPVATDPEVVERVIEEVDAVDKEALEDILEEAQ